MQKIENKIKKIASKDLNLISFLKLVNIFIKLDKEESIIYVELFIKEYYYLKEEMTKEFYELIINQLHNGKYLSLFDTLIEKNIYLLISYLKYSSEDIVGLEDIITPLQYYNIPKRYINHIIEKLKKLDIKNNDSNLDNIVKDETIWLLKKLPHFNYQEYMNIAYKIYLSIGLNNGLELLGNKYGLVDYEKIHFLFLELNVKDGLNEESKENFCNFLFKNKRDYNNTFRQMLRGEFIELFLNFDYFHNNFNYFIDRLGVNLPKDKVRLLIKDRFLTHSAVVPQITRDILDDMLSSYYCKYEYLDISKDEVYSKNMDIYNKYLKNKYKSSIPMIDVNTDSELYCDVLSLNDPRNLVLGYRSGNCFRINGDASILFHNFLKSEHMKLVSISTKENKDYAMMLVMRNGNVLIGQGIEVSKWVSSNIKGKKLYDTCRLVLEQMMDYMNSNGDEIVATIIGCSNENVSEYNNQILPFLVNPILDINGNYYNGIYNYQCLLDLYDGRSLSDIKLYIPSIKYLDKRDSVLRRYNSIYDNNYREIEKRLIALRFLRSQKEGNYQFYNKLSNHREVYTCCNKDWYITLFDDGTTDGFVANIDERAKEEYDLELAKIQQYILKNNKKKHLVLKRKRINIGNKV